MHEQEMIKKPIGVRILRGILIGFGLFLLNLIFILGPYIAVWGIIIGVVAGGFASILSGVTLIIAYLFSLPFTLTLPTLIIEQPILMLLAGGVLIGLGGVLMSTILWMTKYIVYFSGKYILWNLNIIRGEEYE